MRLGTLAVTAAFGVLVSGCSGGADAQPTHLPSLTATPLTSPSPATVPLAATAHTPEGADSFVRFFFEQLNIAFSSSDASIIRAFSNSECTTCDNYAKALAAARKNGHFLKGQSFAVSNVAAAPLQPRGTLVEVFGAVPPRTQVDANGRTVSALAADGPFHFTVAVKLTGAGWVVSGIKLGSP